MQVVDDLRRAQLITNILTSSSLLEAFKKTNISPPTGYNYLNDQGFQEELKTATRQIYDTTLTRLSGLSETAYEALADLLQSKNENVKAKAVTTYFTMMLNPKSSINDAEAAELRRFVEEVKDAISSLDGPTKKAFKEALERKRTG